MVSTNLKHINWSDWISSPSKGNKNETTTQKKNINETNRVDDSLRKLSYFSSIWFLEILKVRYLDSCRHHQHVCRSFKQLPSSEFQTYIRLKKVHTNQHRHSMYHKLHTKKYQTIRKIVAQLLIWKDNISQKRLLQVIHAGKTTVKMQDTSPPSRYSLADIGRMRTATQTLTCCSMMNRLPQSACLHYIHLYISISVDLWYQIIETCGVETQCVGACLEDLFKCLNSKLEVATTHSTVSRDWLQSSHRTC